MGLKLKIVLVTGAEVVGKAVVGLTVVGFIVGADVVGNAVVGPAVVGLWVVGDIVGADVVGNAVVGSEVVGLPVVGLDVLGLAVVGAHDITPDNKNKIKMERHFPKPRKIHKLPYTGHFLRLCEQILRFLLNFSQNVPHALSDVSYYADTKCAGKSRPWRIQRWVKRPNPRTWDRSRQD